MAAAEQPPNDRKAAGCPAFVLCSLEHHHWYRAAWHVSRGPSPLRGLSVAESTSFDISRPI